MSTPTQILSNLENSPQINIAPKPYVLQSRGLHRRQSPAAELLQENNSLLSSRINGSHIAPASLLRPGNSSGCRGLKRERVAIAKDGENSKRESQNDSEILSLEPLNASQLNNRLPPAAGQGPAKENQSRCQAPMRMRKNNSIAEPRSAMLPSSSTGKLIERSRQKVAEKHASKDFGVNGLSRMSTLTEREVVGNQEDQLLSIIELTKNSLYKDQRVIRHYMNKHKKTVDSVGQKHIENF